MKWSGLPRFALMALFLGAAFLRGTGSPIAHANPAKIWVINGNVAAATAAVPVSPASFDTAMSTSAGRSTYLSQFDAFQTASAGQVTLVTAAPYAGSVYIIVRTDGSPASLTLNGRGLTCTPVCDGATTSTPDPTDNIVVYRATDGYGAHLIGDTLVATALQDAVSLDSRTITVVGQAHDIQLSVSRMTVQEAYSTCAINANQAAPSNGLGRAVYTDITGVPLVGYMPTFGTSSIATLLVGNTAATGGSSQQVVTMLQPDGTTIAGVDSYCGVAAGSANLSATTTAGEATVLTGQPFPVTRTSAITVTGVPASIALTASPTAVPCDGTQTSAVTAKVKDMYGNNVADGTPVNFSVVALGTANPINAKTVAGVASSTVTPLSGAISGVTVIVTSGDAQSSIQVDCALPPTTTPAVTHASSGGLTTTVQATLTGAQPNTSYRIDFFDNPACGALWGGTFVAAFSASSDGAGNLRLTELLSTYVTKGWVLQATATASGSLTSPMSGCQTVAARACDDDTTCNGYTDAQKIALAKDPFTYCGIMRADVNMDGKATLADLILTAQHYNQTIPPAPARDDQNGDGKITLADLVLEARNYHESVSACP